MKYYADKRRTKRHFEERDWVWLKLQPYMQITVRGNTPSKLAAQYFSPYHMLAKIGTVTYRL